MERRSASEQNTRPSPRRGTDGRTDQGRHRRRRRARLPQLQRRVPRRRAVRRRRVHRRADPEHRRAALSAGARRPALSRRDPDRPRGRARGRVRTRGRRPGRVRLQRRPARARDARRLARARRRRRLRAARAGSDDAPGERAGDRGLGGADRLRQVADRALDLAAAARSRAARRRDPPSDAVRRPRARRRSSASPPAPTSTAGRCTIEEREEYEPHLAAGNVVYAGVDYARIVARGAGRGRRHRLGRRQQRLPVRPPGPAHRRSSTRCARATRPGYHPGEAVLRMADVVVDRQDRTPPRRPTSSASSTRCGALQPARARSCAPRRRSALDDPAARARQARRSSSRTARRVTHGGMRYGAGYVAATTRRAPPRSSIRARSRRRRSPRCTPQYPALGPVLPAMGYSPAQLAALARSIDAVPTPTSSSPARRSTSPRSSASPSPSCARGMSSPTWRRPDWPERSIASSRAPAPDPRTASEVARPQRSVYNRRFEQSAPGRTRVRSSPLPRPPPAMRLSLRFVLPLLLAIGLVAYAVRPLVDQLTLQVVRARPRHPRAADRQHRPGAARRPRRARTRGRRSPRSSTASPRTSACTRSASATRSAGSSPARATSPPTSAATASTGSPRARRACSRAPRARCTSRSRASAPSKRSSATLVVVHDMSFVTRRSEETKRYVFWFLVGLGALVSLITVVIAQLSWRGWVQGMKALLRGEGIAAPRGPHRDARAAAARPRPAHADARARDRLPLARREPDHLDARRRCARSCATTCAARRSWSSPTASPTSTCAAAGGSRSSARRAAWSPRSSRSCAPARAPGSRTAAAPPTARSSTGTTASACRPRARATGSAASGSRGGGGRLLLRLRERGAVAALPHRARAADLPRRGLGAATSR